MAYIGNNSSVSNIQKIDALTFNSSTTTFDIRVNGLLVVVGSSTSLFISVGGVIQEPSVDYSVNGSSIIFTTAPLTGMSFFGIILGSSVNIGTPADSTVTNAKIGEAIAVSKGGTGATTADAALTNLGGGAAGKSVFASVTQANARTALVAAKSGDNSDLTSIPLETTLGVSGPSIGYRDVPQININSNYTLSLTDAGKHILHPSADTTARTITIPQNTVTAFPVGTAITVINQNNAGVITLSIAGADTLRFAGIGSTGSRSIAANGIATILKITSIEWIVSGAGVT